MNAKLGDPSNPTDRESLIRISMHEDCLRFSGSEFSTEESQRLRLAQWEAGDSVVWFLLGDDEQPIGFIEACTLELGIVQLHAACLPEGRGKPMKALAKACIAHAEALISPIIVEAYIDHANYPAGALLRAMKFVKHDAKSNESEICFWRAI